MKGLMAPVGSKERRDYDEAARRASGWGGLLSAVADPLTWLPGPVGDAAQVAVNIGEQGPMQGLMASWDVVGLPKVLRQGPKVLKMFEKVPVSDPKLEKALKVLAKDVAGPEARELHARTGNLVTTKGDLLGEFSDYKAGVTPRFYDVLDAVQRRGDPSYTASAAAKDLFSHPELFKRHPETADLPVKLRVDRRLAPGTMAGEYGGANSTLFVPPQEAANDIKNALETWLHENQHHIQRKQGLQGGSNENYIKTLLTEAVNRYSKGDTPPWMDPDFERMFKRAAMSRYLNTEGELWARNVEARKNLKPDMLRSSFPYDQQTAAYSQSPIAQRSRVQTPYDQDQIEAIARRLLGIPEAPP